MAESGHANLRASNFVCRGRVGDNNLEVFERTGMVVSILHWPLPYLAIRPGNTVYGTDGACVLDCTSNACQTVGDQ